MFLIGYKVDGLRAALKELEDSFAGKAELADVREDVAGIKSGIAWALKIVLGAVLVAIVRLVLVEVKRPRCDRSA